MKTVLRHHPLKMIQLRFQDDMRPPEFELAALRKYYTAHDKTWELKIQYEQQKGWIMLLHNDIFDHYALLIQLEEELENIKEALDIGTPPDLDYFQEQFDIDLALFFNKIEDHSKQMQDIHDKVSKQARLHSDAITRLHEDNYLIELHYFELFHEVFQRHEEVQVDTVSLDDDYQEFLRVYNEVDELLHDYTARADEAFDAYVNLYNESEALYRYAEMMHNKVEKLFET